MKLEDDPFPNFQPIAFISNLEDYDCEATHARDMPYQERNQAILDYMSGKISAVQIEADKDRQINANFRRYLVAGPK